jgi:hypothetical protein
MAKIAISYRRSDSQPGRIFDRLVQRYGKDTVFRDIDSIQPGIDFRRQIADALRTTDVLGDETCIRDAYLSRIAQLQSWH